MTSEALYLVALDISSSRPSAFDPPFRKEMKTQRVTSRENTEWEEDICHFTCLFLIIHLSFRVIIILLQRLISNKTLTSVWRTNEGHCGICCEGSEKLNHWLTKCINRHLIDQGSTDWSVGQCGWCFSNPSPWDRQQPLPTSQGILIFHSLQHLLLLLHKCSH